MQQVILEVGIYMLAQCLFQYLLIQLLRVLYRLAPVEGSFLSGYNNVRREYRMSVRKIIITMNAFLNNSYT